MLVFAHGSGSGRLGPRNRFVADALNDAGFSDETRALAPLDRGAHWHHDECPRPSGP